jgi:hypothetical protein
MRKLFQTLGPRWSRKTLPAGAGIDVLGKWALSDEPGDCHLAVGHYVCIGGDGAFDGWYDDLGFFISQDPPVRWAPIPSYYE